MPSIIVRYLTKNLENPNEELFEIEVIKGFKEGRRKLSILRKDLIDISTLYNKVATREYQYFKYGMERPESYAIQITNKEYDDLFYTKDGIEEQNKDEEKEKFNRELNSVLSMIPILREKEMSKIEFWEVPELMESKKAKDKLLRELSRDVAKYRNKGSL